MNINNVEMPTREYVQSGELQLAYYQWGKASEDHESIVLIHGFPDSSEVWKGIAQNLAKNFHVVTYDVRGTGYSDIPWNKKDYSFEFLIQDLSQIISKVSPNKAVHLVGHDWGALQGWEAVLNDRLKSQIRSYIAMAPSLDHLVGWWFRDQYKQGTIQNYRNIIERIVGSSYMGFFQIPILPELSWRFGFALIWPKIVAMIEKTKVESDARQTRNSISSLGLYRQNLLNKLKNPSKSKTTIPVLMLNMSKDPFIPTNLSDGLNQWVNNLQYDEVNAGHWGILSHPEEISTKIMRYIINQSKAI